MVYRGGVEEAPAYPGTRRSQCPRADVLASTPQHSRTRAFPQRVRLRFHSDYLRRQTLRGVCPHAIRRVKKEIGGRLASGDVAGTKDSANEARVEPCEPQRVANPLVGTTRRDAGRGREFIENLENAGNGFEPGFERLPIQALEGLFPVRRERAAEMGLDLGYHVLIRPAHEALDYFRLGHHPTKLREHDDIDPHGNTFAVHQHTIAI